MKLKHRILSWEIIMSHIQGILLKLDPFLFQIMNIIIIKYHRIQLFSTKNMEKISVYLIPGVKIHTDTNPHSKDILMKKT